MVCHSCGREIKLIGAMQRKDECPHCKADTLAAKIVASSILAKAINAPNRKPIM